MSGTDGKMRVEETLRDLWSTRPRRPKDDRKIAGVAAAIGNRYGIDPVVIRVALVVTAIYGGIGLVAYLAAWLLLPGWEDRVSPLESLIGRGSSGTPKIVTICLVFALFPAFGWVAATAVGGVFALIALVLVAFLLHRARGSRTAAAPPPDLGVHGLGSYPTTVHSRVEEPMPHQPTLEPATARTTVLPDQPPAEAPAAETTVLPVPDTSVTTELPVPAPQPEDAAHTAAEAPAEPVAAEPVAETSAQPAETAALAAEAPAPPAPSPAASAPLPAPNFPPVTYPAIRSNPPQWDPLGAAPFAWDLPEPRRTAEVEPEPEPKRKTRVTAVTLALAFIVGSVSGILAGLVPWFTAPHVIGMVVAVLSLGVLVGAFRGGGRLLVLLLVPAAVVTFGVTVDQRDNLNLANFDQYYRLNEVGQLRPFYEARVGSLDFNLAEVDFTKAPPEGVTTSVVLGAGSINVLLPANVDVDLRCRARMGSVNCLENQTQPGDSLTMADNGPDGPGGGKLTLRLEVQGPGSVEVHRVG